MKGARMVPMCHCIGNNHSLPPEDASHIKNNRDNEYHYESYPCSSKYMYSTAHMHKVHAFINNDITTGLLVAWSGDSEQYMYRWHPPILLTIPVQMTPIPIYTYTDDTHPSS